MAFDWLSFFNSRNVDYSESGANVSAKNVTIRCPFCPDDPSKHLSVSTEGKGWRCFRNPEHRGKSPVRLIAQLLGVSIAEAAQIAGMRLRIPSDVLRSVLDTFEHDEAIDSARTIRLPPEFKRLHDQLPSRRPFVAYMQRRGYSEEDTTRLALRWRLLYATHGPYRGRIIFPVYYRRKLMTWTGRTISSAEPIRYKALSDDKEKARSEGLPRAIGKITSFLLWRDQLRKTSADTLLLCEGPFDALRVNALGRGKVVATCFFTAAPSNDQIMHVHSLRSRFRDVALLLDRGTLSVAMTAKAKLASAHVRLLTLPDRYKDPGELDTSEALFALLA